MKIRYFILPILTIQSLYGAVYDAIPSDYIAAKPGIQVISINFLERDLIGPYNKGNKLTNDSISQKTFYLRYNYTEQINDYTSSFGFALPFSKLETKGSNLGQFIGKKSTGISDLVLSSTLWLKNDNVNKEYLGLTFLVSLPTGKFEESQTLNSGENRYKYIINMGYIKPLDERFTLEVSPELAFYGDNKTTVKEVEQKPSFAINTNLRYKINKSYEVLSGYKKSYNSKKK